MNKKLFAFDMDGTLLSNSQNAIVSPETKQMIGRLKKAGHVVCLFTGRPWRGSEKIYKELKLDTIMVNYNGGYIHHPKKYDFISSFNTVSINKVIRVIESDNIKKIANNVVIEGVDFIHLQKIEKSFFVDEFIRVQDKNIITSPINYAKMTDNPIGILIEVKKEYAKNIHDVTRYFKSRFGDLGEFYYWKTGKNNNPILEFTSFKAKKSIALIKAARYYGIDMNDTLAFGDGYNDIEMIKIAGVGVAMSNADEVVKAEANVVSRFTNKENGVPRFIKWYLKDGHEKIEKTIYSLDHPSISPTREIEVD